MEVLNIEQALLSNINYPDVYFTPYYGISCSQFENKQWELCIFEDVMLVYLKKYNKELNGFELISPHGYSGIYYQNSKNLKLFLELFLNYCKKNNYKKVILRQTPYSNINFNIFHQYFSILNSKSTFGIFIIFDNISQYLNNTSKNNKRTINKALTFNLDFKFELFTNTKEFLDFYTIGMKELNASDNYKYDLDYFNNLIGKNCYNAKVYYQDKLISTALIFDYEYYYHYHLGVSKKEFRFTGCNNFLHYKVIEFAIKNNKKLYHLGGGLEDNDSLYNFKKRLSNTEFIYNIFSLKL